MFDISTSHAVRVMRLVTKSSRTNLSSVSVDVMFSKYQSSASSLMGDNISQRLYQVMLAQVVVLNYAQLQICIFLRHLPF